MKNVVTQIEREFINIRIQVLNITLTIEALSPGSIELWSVSEQERLLKILQCLRNWMRTNNEIFPGSDPFESQPGK